MFKRWSGLTCLALAGYFGSPSEVGCQENKGGIKLLVPRIKLLLDESAERRSYCFVGFVPTNLDVPFAGICHDVFLGSTPFGGFSASVDLRAALITSGPGVTFYWYPWEDVVLSFRMDMLRR